jgi:hypothetical protein
MAKSLACWLGRHTWEDRVYEGDSYMVCAVCGKPPRGGGEPKPPMSGVDQWSSAGWKSGP